MLSIFFCLKNGYLIATNITEVNLRKTNDVYNSAQQIKYDSSFCIENKSESGILLWREIIYIINQMMFN